MAYEKWGNNEFHDSTICENCEFDSCHVCSNGPRLEEFRREEAFARIRDNVYTIQQGFYILGDGI